MSKTPNDDGVWVGRPAIPPPPSGSLVVRRAPSPPPRLDVTPVKAKAPPLQLARASRVPSAQTLAIVAWFVVVLALACLVFGLPRVVGFFGASARLVALASTHNGIRVIAFAALAMLVLFGALWAFEQIIRHNKLFQFGACMITAGIAGGFVAVGGVVLDVDFGSPATGLLWVFSVLLFILGAKAVSESPPEAMGTPPAPRPPSPQKKEDIYGDARPAEADEIHVALGDKSGGFEPMFKD